MIMAKKYIPEMLDLIYIVGKEVYEHETELNQYREKCERMGINWNSFRGWFVPAFRYMRNGVTLKGSIPQVICKYMLERIYNEYGSEGLRLALKSYIGTIRYYELKGKNKPGDRLIIQHFQNLLNKS